MPGINSSAGTNHVVGGLAALISAGGVSVPDAALSANVALQNAANNFTATQSVKALRLNGVDIQTGSSKPAGRGDGVSALVAGDMWRKTGLVASEGDSWWFWDGTRWLSQSLFVKSLNYQASSTTNNYLNVELVQNTQYNIYVVDLVGNSFVVTNDNTNNWTVSLNRRTLANSNVQIATYSTSADTQNQWSSHKVSVNTLLDLTTDIKALVVILTKNSAPSNFLGEFQFTYRLAHQ